jgi:FkbM family methyltransferase
MTQAALRKVWCRLRRRIRPHGTTRVRLAGIRLRVPVRSEYFLHYFHYGAYEPATTTLFRRYLRPGNGVIDVGANAGLFTLLAAQLVRPSGWVAAVEPDPRSIALLESNLRASGASNVRVWPAALAAEKGRGALRQAADSMYSTMVIGAVRGEDAMGTIGVECLTFEDICRDRAAADIRLIKIDAEGSEPAIIRGGRRFLRGIPDDCLIVCEFNPAFNGEEARGTHALGAEFKNSGFALLSYDMYSNTFVPLDLDAVADSVNVVACRDPGAAARALREVR